MTANEKKRRAYTSHLTAAINKLNAQLAEESTDVDKITSLIEQVQTKFKKVEDMAAKMEDEFTDDAALEEDIERLDLLENQVIEIRVKAKSALERLKKKPEAVNESDELTQHPVYYSPPVYTKLPDATLQEFTGDEEKFPSFIDQFTALVDNNQQLSEVEKFGYLKGAAKVDVIQHYPLTANNYKIALQKLKEEYGDEDLIAQKHLSSLLDMSKRKKPSDNRELQEFYNFLEAKLACLEALRRPVEQTNKMLITLIYRQLPKKLQIKVANLDSTHNTVQEVMNIIKKHIKTIKKMEHREASDSESEEDIYSYSKIRKSHKKMVEKDSDEEDIKPISSASALPVIAQRPRACIFCGDNHSPVYCQRVTDVSQRREIVRNANACFNCLAIGHRATHCRSDWRCRACNRKHHSSLCAPDQGFIQQQRSGTTTDHRLNQQHGSGTTNDHRFNQQQRSGRTTDQGFNQPQRNRQPTNNTNVGLTTASSWEATGSVLLQMAETEIRKPGGQKYLTANIFFDLGSQLSYTLKQVKQELNLDVLQRDVMELNTFGNTDTVVASSEVVVLQIVKGDFTKEIALHTTETICNPLPSYKITNRRLRELQGISLASPRCKYDETHEISILIGADLYWQFVDTESINTSWGARAVKSKLGWLLSGPVSNTQSSSTTVYLTTSKVIKSMSLDEVPINREWIKNQLSDSPPDTYLEKLETISEEAGTTEKIEIGPRTHHTSSFPVINVCSVDKGIKVQQAKLKKKEHIYHAVALSVLAVGDNYQDVTRQKETTEDIHEVDDWFQYKIQSTITDRNVELRWFWETEHIGIIPEDQEPSTLEIFLEKIKYCKETRSYEVEFPCKLKMLEALPDNRHICELRLQSLLTKLSRAGNEEMLNSYNDIIKRQLEEGVIEEVTPDQNTEAVIHYLPHHCVIKKEKKTSAVRIVYDGSAKASKNSLSLNQCLEAGPSLVNNLASVLLRFRMFQIGLVADISKAFLKLSLATEDRDLTRFLWREHGNLNCPIKIYRFTRVPFGLTSSPFLLHATIIHHLSQYEAKYPEIVPKLLKSFYVDDMVSGTETEEDAVKLANGTDNIMKEANMELHKWNTNKPKVLDACNVPSAGKPRETSIKILGLPWNTNLDQFEFSIEPIIELAERLKPTKLTVLRVLQKVYDPLGTLSPYMITVKILFQKLCRLDLPWNELIPEEMMSEWRSWIMDLKKMRKFTIPRCVKPGSKPKLELVGFCDASKSAYAAVIYLRCSTNNTVKTNFVISKAKVAPMKQQTIPRLELLGAVLLTRLFTLVLEFLSQWKFTRCTCYTDSMNVFFWIRGSKKWNRYISKRLEEINSLSSKLNWQHCDGDDNPADYPTRGMTMDQLCNSKEWLHGPSWLSEIEFTPERKPIIPVPTPECLVEEVKKVHAHAVTEVSGIDRILNIEDYNTLGRLYRVTAYILRFVKEHMQKKEVSSLEMQRYAETKWIINQQRKHHGQILPYLRGEVTKPAVSMPKQLDLFIDDKGVVRCAGRFKYANLCYRLKYPILLSKESHLTTLIIRDRHRRVKHAGIKSTLAEVREEYWIPRGRRMIQKMIRHCVICRRLTAKPFQAPGPPPLPALRLSEMPPFTNTGLDFAGPLYCRERGMEEPYKSYIALYTCASARAVHLELVPSMSSTSVKNSMIRFVSARGIPECMISDNAKSFKKTAEDLNCLITRSPTQEFIEDNKITWLFYLEKSPWWGGFIERMVGSVKSVLRKTLYRCFLSYDDMTTLLKEIESVVNSRPITQMFDEADQPLTPSHLLIGKRSTQLPTNELYIHDTDDVNRYRERLLDVFKRRWKKEFLSQLQDYHISTQTARDADIVPKIDEIVIMKEASPRSTWKLARVLKINEGKDGKIRSLEVRKSNGQIVRRPPQLLIPLECNIPK